MAENLEQFNNIAKGAGAEISKSLKAQVQALSSSDRNKLYRSISYRLYKTYGMVDRIAIKMFRYGYWIDLGASRGHGGSKGSTWYDSAGNKRSTDPRSKGKMNSGKRLAKTFIEPVLEPAIDKLADQLAEKYGDYFVKGTFNHTVNIK